MNKIIKNALILAEITLIAGLLLGAAHQVTLEPIQKQQEKEKQESCQNVFPEAASFEEVTMSDAEQAELTAALIGHGFEAQTIDELLLAKDASGATIGLVEIISTTEGYGGGLLFGAVFMATDYVTSPFTLKGKLVYGVALGIVTFAIRYWGSYTEGVSFALLFMNLWVPYINDLTRQTPYGYVKPAKKAKEGAGK